MDVLIQLLLREEGGSVDSGEHLVLLGASPVGAGPGHEFEALAHLLRVYKVRSRAQVGEIALAEEGNLLVLRQILDELHLVGLLLLLHEFDGLPAGKNEPLHGITFLDNLLHLGLDLRKICLGDELLAEVHIVVEAVVDGRADGQLRIGVQGLDGLGHHMGCGVAERGKHLRILLIILVDRAVVFNNLDHFVLLSMNKTSEIKSPIPSVLQMIWDESLAVPPKLPDCHPAAQMIVT